MDVQDARGDQCDACGRLLNATELEEPRCKLDGTRPITKESKHIFLDLDRLQGDIEKFNARVNVEGKLYKVKVSREDTYDVIQASGLPMVFISPNLG